LGVEPCLMEYCCFVRRDMMGKEGVLAVWSKADLEQQVLIKRRDSHFVWHKMGVDATSVWSEYYPRG
jgi:hypothetical protein